MVSRITLHTHIKDKLNCGNISKSGYRCNYFVNDQKSLINVILPLFNYMELKSSKYFQYLIFKKAVNLLINKEHLTPQGKLKILEYYKFITLLNIYKILSYTYKAGSRRLLI